MVEKDQILSEIRRLADLNGGRPLGRSRFYTQTGIRETDWKGRYWARWNEAVEEAGLPPNKLHARADDDEAIRQIVIEIRRLGRFPTAAELQMRRREDASFPGTGILKRLGPKRVLVERIVSYCEQDQDYADVLDLVVLVASSEAGQHAEESPPSDLAEYGFVYLLKSGRHYKVGHTNSVGRRAYELAIQLPERASVVHQISTDDPPGIEAYWHRRFADRRQNGEWFELTRSDVTAFKRRKFM